jgi:transmembrane sensor
MESHKQMEDRAAAWLAKRDSGDWSEDEQARLMRWIGEAVAHRVAFLRLEGVWEETRRMKALAAGRPPGTVPPPGEWRDTPFFELSRRQAQETADVDSSTALPTPREQIGRNGDIAGPEIVPDGNDAQCDGPPAEGTSNPSVEFGRRSPQVFAARGWRLFATAASLVLALVIGGYVTFSPAADHYSTPIGGIASVPLRDGSNVTLNTASRVRVALSPDERRIDLQQGEAFFEVAKDPKRPFVVRIGDRRVIAVGTQFSVRRDGNDIRVVVTEGTVRLESANIALSATRRVPGATSRTGSGEGAGVRLPEGSSGSAIPESTSLTAGTIARATDDDVLVERASIPQAEDILSWRQGYLRFHDTPLGDVVAEFNRYNSHTITIVGPNVATIHISGTFRPTNYEAFVRLLRDGFSIHAEADGDRIILTK